jgi:spore coat protein U-like protein
MQALKKIFHGGKILLAPAPRNPGRRISVDRSAWSGGVFLALISFFLRNCAKDVVDFIPVKTPKHVDKDRLDADNPLSTAVCKLPPTWRAGQCEDAVVSPPHTGHVMKKIQTILAVAAATVALVPVTAFSATATSTLSVSATVLTACIVATTPVAFGNYNPTAGSATNNTGTVAVTCTSGAPYNVLLDPGAATGATVTTRKMKDATTDLLPYTLYRDSARTLNWGQTIATDTLSGTGSGVIQTLTVYGSVPAGAAVPAGVYSDTVNVTVNY